MLSCDVIIWDDNTPLFYFSWKLHSLRRILYVTSCWIYVRTEFCFFSWRLHNIKEDGSKTHHRIQYIPIYQYNNIVYKQNTYWPHTPLLNIFPILYFSDTVYPCNFPQEKFVDILKGQSNEMFDYYSIMSSDKCYGKRYQYFLLGSKLCQDRTRYKIYFAY